jgi:hypothetical protein
MMMMIVLHLLVRGRSISRHDTVGLTGSTPRYAVSFFSNNALQLQRERIDRPAFCEKTGGVQHRPNSSSPSKQLHIRSHFSFVSHNENSAKRPNSIVLINKKA